MKYKCDITLYDEKAEEFELSNGVYLDEEEIINTAHVLSRVIAPTKSWFIFDMGCEEIRVLATDNCHGSSAIDAKVQLEAFGKILYETTE